MVREDINSSTNHHDKLIINLNCPHSKYYLFVQTFILFSTNKNPHLNLGQGSKPSP
jgi:hypothetical protein